MNTETLTVEDRINLTEDWLLNSGIQSNDGGFYAWQDMEDKSHPYLYSEITGYAITTLCFLYSVTKNKIFMKKAKSAAKWMIEDALDPSGGILTRRYLKNMEEHYSFERGNIYSFDCAMAAFGILKLYKLTKDAQYLECAGKIMNFLNDRMLKSSGLYYPIFDVRNNRAQEDPAKWSTQSGSFHCKLALLLCEFAVLRKDNSYNAIAKKLIESSIDLFFKGDRFITNTRDNSSHLHPYSYTLEGILYYSRMTKDNAYEDIIEKAFSKITSYQAADGGLPTQVLTDKNSGISYQRADIQAQILRLSYFIKYDLDRNRLFEKLLSFQNITIDRKGGFLFGTDRDGTFKKHSNAWCSMFALQALCLASSNINREIILEYLV